MPTLNWIGKDKVINHHLDVPFRTLVPSYSFGDAESAKDNLIIHGDNLEALKALLPQYEGKVKLIYIDPPYNTGNEGWVYNDNVNDPKIKKWLGEVVGKEGEDLSRHDKWLCMMYPRLKLLHKLLKDDGVIFISIDNNEETLLKLVCDEIFRSSNFLAKLIWKSRQFVDSRAVNGISNDHEYILVYAKDSSQGHLRGKDRDISKYSNPDNDSRGPWMSRSMLGLANKEQRPNLHYNLLDPKTELSYPCAENTGWRYSRDTMASKLQEGRIIFPRKPDGRPREKVFLNELTSVGGGFPSVIDDIFTSFGTAEIRSLFGKQIFDFPKASDLLVRLCEQASDQDSIILDSFAGSGTTAHAVLKLNHEDGGHRKFIMIEMEDYAETITAERVRRVINGYGSEGKEVPGTSGGFSYLTLGPAVFTAEGALNPEVEDEALRQYIWYAETKTALPAKKLKNKFHLGSAFNVSYYFYYIKGQETVLDFDFLKTVKDKDEQYVIYADSCAIDSEYLKSRNITFKKIPRDIPRY